MFNGDIQLISYFLMIHLFPRATQNTIANSTKRNLLR